MLKLGWNVVTNSSLWAICFKHRYFKNSPLGTQVILYLALASGKGLDPSLLFFKLVVDGLSVPASILASGLIAGWTLVQLLLSFLITLSMH